MKTFSIGFIIPYFGLWPEWFHIYLQICGRYPSIKFLFFTDCEIPGNTFENTEFIKFSLAEFNKLASQKLGMNINLTKPYKLCDFKPAYGLIFEDYLKDIAYWGNSDIDIIYGNLSNFLAKELLDTYDIITARREYLVGHFTLYKNSKKVNLLYQKSRDYKEVFSSSEYLGFDECGFSWWPLLAGVPIDRVISRIQSMTHLVKKMAADGSVKFFSDTLVIEQDKINIQGSLEDWNKILLWNDGHLINLNDQKEYLYFHFHFLKENHCFRIPEWDFVPNRFYISKEGLFII